MKPRRNPARAIAWSALLGLFFPLGLQAAGGSLQFGAAAYTVKESAAAAKITVTRTGGSEGTVTVQFTTADTPGDGTTASPGVDYYPTNGMLTFAPGVMSQSFYVPLINDTAHEGSETVVLSLTNAAGGASLGVQFTTTLNIADNDACTYALSPSSMLVDEIPGAPSFQVIAPEGCNWLVEKGADAGWVGVPTPNGSGNGEVSFSYDPLPGDILSRTARLRVGGQTFTLTQKRPPADLTPPGISIRSPAEGSRQTNSSLTISGTASDPGVVTLVEYRLGNDSGTTEYAPAAGTNAWSALVTGLIPGTNRIWIRARDAADNIAESSRSVVMVEVAAFGLSRTGEGSLSPLLNGQFLDVGKTYTISAKAASRHFFQGWTGSQTSAENPLSFQMAPGFSLAANFIPTPFAAVAGSYDGLLREDPVPRHLSSGFLSLKVGEMGTFSAKLIVAGQRLSCSGRFGLDGNATNVFARPDGTNLTLQLSFVDLAGGGDVISGLLENGDWVAPLQAFRQVYHSKTNLAPLAGRYTIVFPGDPTNAIAVPGGDGYGTMTVGTDGSVKLSATLGDGTKVTQKAHLSHNGFWPFYAPLYKARGSASGWLLFSDQTGSDLSGDVNWTKPEQAAAKFYPDGFARVLTATGSRYRPPTNVTDRILALATGQLAFRGGNIEADFVDAITLSADGKAEGTGDNFWVLTIQKSSGTFSGTARFPGTLRNTPFRGVVQQKGNFGGGFFSGTNQTGQVQFSD